jgi:hypothetical protein
MFRIRKNDRKGYNKVFFAIVLSDAGFKAGDDDHGPLWDTTGTTTS